MDTPLDKYASYIGKFRSAAAAAVSTAPTEVWRGLMLVDTSDLKELLCKKAAALETALLEQLLEKSNTTYKDVSKQCEELCIDIMAVAANAKAVFELKALLTKCDADVEDMRKMLGLGRDRDNFRIAYRNELLEDDFDLSVTAQAWPAKMADALNSAWHKVNAEHVKVQGKLKSQRETLSMVNAEHVKFQGKLKSQRETLKADIVNTQQACQAYRKIVDVNEVAETSHNGSQISNTLDQYQELASSINEEELLFGWDVSEWPQIGELQKEHEPYASLWSIIFDLGTRQEDWLFGAVQKLDPEEVEELVNEWYKRMQRLAKSLPQAEQRKLAEETRAKLEEYKSIRHGCLSWLVCATQKMGNKVVPGEELTLSGLLKGNILKHLDGLQDISDGASREHSLEKSLDRMQQEWNNVHFELSPWKNTGSFILKGSSVEEAQVLLDDHTIKSQAMASSPAAAPFAERIEQWPATAQPQPLLPHSGSMFTSVCKNPSHCSPTGALCSLALCVQEDIFDEWMKCQVRWMYLGPVYGSEEIAKQMPKERYEFQGADRKWRSIMENVQQTSLVIQMNVTEHLIDDLMGYEFQGADRKWRSIMETVQQTSLVIQMTDTEHLIDDLMGCNGAFNNIERSLNEYLDSKKIIFPRFFFLSNDELIEILSEAKDPLQVQPFVKKIFEAVECFEFNAGLEIVGMVSIEGEKIPFDKPVETAGEYNGVERWLLMAEDMMRKSLATITRQSFESYPTQPRGKWILQWPGQIVLAVGQTYWSAACTKAIMEGGTHGLTTLAAKNTDELMEEVMLVRGELTTLERATLGSLVVLDVHGRDVVVEMVKDEVAVVEDFSWQSRLRYYYEDNELLVRMLNAMCVYRYEYLGNSTRLVNTLLTDHGIVGVVVWHCGWPCVCGRVGGCVGASLLTLGILILAGALTENSIKQGLQPLPAFLDKAIQLYEMIIVRHGLMLVGQSFGMKTSAIRVLADKESLKTKYYTINPKSAARDTSPDRKWLVFDGPVDAIWIENMNTVLDDNKKLCLNSGEIVAMQARMNMIFEVADLVVASPDPARMDMIFQVVDLAVASPSTVSRCGMGRMGMIFQVVDLVVCIPRYCVSMWHGVHVADLAVASPATVSRCGMVYMQASLLGWRPVVMSWLQSLPAACVKESLQEHVLKLFDWLAPPLLRLVTKDCQCPVHMQYRQGHDSLIKEGILSDPASLATHLCSQLIGKQRSIKDCQGPVHMQYRQGHDSLIKEGILSDSASLATHLCSQLIGKQRSIKDCQGPVHMQYRQGHDSLIKEGILSDPASLATHLCSQLIGKQRSIKDCQGPVHMQYRQGHDSLIKESILSDPASLATHLCSQLIGKQRSIKDCQGPVHMQKTKVDKGLPRPSAHAACVKESLQEHVLKLFDWLVPPLLRLVTKDCQCPVQMQEINLVQSCCRLMQSLLDGLLISADDAIAQGLPPPPAVSDPTALAENAFLFSLVWSLGGVIDEAGRVKFSNCLTGFMKGQYGDYEEYVGEEFKGSKPSLKKPIPQDGSVYDWVYHGPTNSWKLWMDTVASQNISSDAEYSQIIVTTVDVVRYTFMISTLVAHHMPLLLVGPTGTGKSVYIQNHLNKGLDRKAWLSVVFNFSAQTSAKMTQGVIDGKLDKRRKGVYSLPVGRKAVIFVDDLNMRKLDKRRKGVYGPPVGRKAVIFVDDLNMPMVEKYGAQPPIELLRQFMDHNGWYDHHDLHFRKMVDVQFMAAMGPPGGGRHAVTNRYMRHYHVLHITEFDDKSKTQIFSSLVDWWFLRSKYSEDLVSKRDALVAASLDLYSTVMLPTPAKTHYIFNLRDLDALVAASLDLYSTVMQELLPTPAKTHYIFNLRDLDALVAASLDLYSTVMKELDALVAASLDLYSTVMQELLPTPAKTHYIFNLRDLSKVFQGMTAAGNVINSPDKLVRLWLHECLRVFHDRLIDDTDRQWIVDQIKVQASQGGKPPGERGRSKPAKVLSHLENNAGQAGQVGLNELHNLLFGDFMIPGAEPAQYDEIMDVSKMVSVVTEYLAESNSASKKPLNLVLFQFALEHIARGDQAAWWPCPTPFMQDYHIYQIEISSSYSMSDWKDDLRSALRTAGEKHKPTVFLFADSQILEESMVPNLFDTGDIITIGEAVPNLFDTGDIITIGEADKLGIQCMEFHRSTRVLSEKYRKEARRHFYVTPTSYLQLLASFKTLLNRKQDEALTARRRYEIGLEKLATTESSVLEMQSELEALQPKLIVSTKETEDLMEVIEGQTVEADKVKVVVQADQASAMEEAAKVTAIKEECEADLKQALPAYNNFFFADEASAMEEAAKVTAIKEEWVGMKIPLKLVKMVMEAVCILDGLTPCKVKDPNTGQYSPDYWETAKKMMSDMSFLDFLHSYDKDNIAPEIITALQPLLKQPDFQPAKIKKVSQAAYGLCSWVRAMETYDKVAKVVRPKRAALKEAEEQLATVMAALKVKQDQLAEVERKLALLGEQLDTAKAKKAQLESDVAMCTEKLDRAQKLIGGLGGEKKRWTQSATDLGELYNRLIGDMLLSSGVIAYLGAFTTEYRNEAPTSLGGRTTEEKREPCQPLDPPHAEPAPPDVKGNPAGTPPRARTNNPSHEESQKKGPTTHPNPTGRDRDFFFSIANGIVVHEGQRWPLCIDPQGQANKWRPSPPPGGAPGWRPRDSGRSVDSLTEPVAAALRQNPSSQLRLANGVWKLGDAESVLPKQTFKQSGFLFVELGDLIVDWHPDFRL
eukprot:gene21154-28043_t